MLEKGYDETRIPEHLYLLTLGDRIQAGPGVEIAFLGDGETKVEFICNKTSQEIKIGQDISGI